MLQLEENLIQMNRFRTITLLLIVLLVLVACGGEEPEESVELTRVVDTPSVTDEESANTPMPEEPTGGEAPTLPPPVVEEVTPNEPPPPTPTPGEAGAEVPAEPTPLPPWPAEDFGYGVQSHAVVGDPAFAMDVVKNQLGMDWVKVQLEWPLIQPEPGELRQWFFYDGVVDEAAEKGLYLMFSVVGAPAWTRAAGTENGPPDDYQLFANFLTELINRYPDKIHAIEVWNEQNLDREWATAAGISPEDYVEFLELAYETIKAADSEIVVISGALAPTGDGDWVRWADDFDYMERALAAGMLDHADCIGAHHNGYNIPSNIPYQEASSLPEAATAEFRGPFDNPHHSWSFQTTLNTYASMIQALDPEKKLCVTEFGWASSEGYDAYPEGFAFALDNTEEEQAQYIVQAFQQMHASGDVWLTYLFNYDFGNKGNGPTDDPVPYSIIHFPDGSPRPAFAAVAEMEKPR